MPAFTFKFPNNPRVYCDRPECNDLAEYELHERDLETFPDAKPIYACAAHMPPMMQNRARQLRMQRLKVAGDPTQGAAGA